MKSLVMITGTGRPSRAGSVFLFCFGLLLVMVALAYTFMASSRVRRDANEKLHMLAFAELAANQGAGHVIDVLTRDYLQHPHVPTNTNLGYVREFAPIDTDRVGKDTRSSDVGSPGTKYRPIGDPASREDENENDTKTETLLTSVYNSVYAGGGTYRRRADSFLFGMMLSNGLGRFIEPGYYHTDMTGKPISFHLEHPMKANSGSPDPAEIRGEDWVPDRNDPLYLDSNLLPAANRDSARYRLRYAVAIEDLSGHLPLSWQGEFTPGANDARTATPSNVDANQVAEVDQAIADRYDSALYNMFALRNYSKAWWGWMIAHGNGYTNWTHPTGVPYYSIERFPLLATVTSGLPYRYTQTDSYQLPATGIAIPAKHTYDDIWNSNKGPVMSANAGRSFLGNNTTTPNLVYTFTPYGRRPVVTNTPGHFRDSYTDCPWQVNLPTAVPDAVTHMLFAYLPAEVKSVEYNDRDKWDFNGFDARGSSLWTVIPEASDGDEGGLRIVGKSIAIDLFSATGFAPLFSHLGGGYPGTDPRDAPAVTSVANWKEDLGAHIDLNEATLQTGSVPYSLKPPFWGMMATFMPKLGDDIEEKAETTFGPPIGQKWMLLTPSAGDMSMFTAAKSYAYGDSYYLDVATAFLHAVAIAQLAWLEDNGAGSNPAPLEGRPTFPAGLTASDLVGYLGDGKPAGGSRDLEMMDRDADGDGSAESPSAYDTIREVDSQFVRNLGEYFGPKLADTPSEGLYMIKYRPAAWPYSLNNTQRSLDWAEAIAYTTNNNIASLLASGDPLVRITVEQARMMELVVNDLRMSFFGASPQYSDFQGIDFDNDGIVRCSAYDTGSAPVVADRFARTIDPAQGDRRFSLTGCFLFQKSHLFRVFIRGEIFDMIRMVPAESTTLEMVYAVDPAGRIYDVNNAPIPAARDPNGDGNPADAEIRDSQVLFQRWHWHKYQAYRPRSYP